MFNGGEEDRKAIIQASEVVGHLAKYSFLGICYLGVAIGVSIKLGNRTIKIIKAHIPNLKKQKGELSAEEEII